MKALDTNAKATEVISHDVTPLTVNTDATAYARIGWIVVLAGFCGFMLWAMFAPLDKGVPMSGTVTSEGNRKQVQNMAGGTVEKIYVKDGDSVKAGQPLVRMNDVVAKAQLDTTRAQYFSARASEARLLAERDGSAAVAFPKALEKYKSDQHVIALMQSQAQLFSSRRGALQSELGAMDESIGGLKAQLAGLEAGRDSRKEQLVFLKEQLVGMRDLAKDGYVARNRLLELERSYSQINGAVAEDAGSIGRAQAQIAELKMRRVARSQDYQKEVRTQLSDVQKEAEALEGRLTGQGFELASVDVKAPVDGVVTGMTIFTQGGVVGAGAKLMEVVPADGGLVVEGQLMTNLVDRVHVGLKVELIFAAFNANKTPHIPGVVTAVSADRTIDEHTGMPYYKVLAKVTPEGAKLLAAQKLDVRPGMPVELFVKTGERTMMSYLLKPLVDRAHAALTEE